MASLTPRDYLEALAALPPVHRAWLELDPTISDEAFPLFCYYGFGVLLNSAQEQAAVELFRTWPAGSIHVWRWANRTGKTTELDLVHFMAIWRKWRYENAVFDDWLAYRYQTLHSAPLNRLMGKAHTLADSLIAGVTDQQRSAITNRQRQGVLTQFFEAGKSQAKDGSDELWVRCLINNSKVDFLSTQGGAGRMESDTWWVISWDEFPRQVPISDIPLLLDQTFLPRTSDHMAPLLLAGTATEDSEPVYDEIEEMAETHPGDWNFSTFDRRVNFSQSKESIERQVRLSFDPEAAGRSVEGLSGQSGYGLFPQFAVDNAFTDELPERTALADLPQRGAGYKFYQSLDHSAGGDEIPLTTWACPFPYDKNTLLERPIIGVEEVLLRSSRTLATPEIIDFAKAGQLRYPITALMVDATGEAGKLIANELRKLGLPVIPVVYSAKLNERMPPNKDVMLGNLQRLMSLGMNVEIDEETYLVKAWPEPTGPFGGLRLPSAWKRTKRQLSTLKQFDKKLEQDRAMAQGQLAWHVWRLYDGAARPKPRSFNVMATGRRRHLVATGGFSGQ